MRTLLLLSVLAILCVGVFGQWGNTEGQQKPADPQQAAKLGRSWAIEGGCVMCQTYITECRGEYSLCAQKYNACDEACRAALVSRAAKPSGGNSYPQKDQPAKPSGGNPYPQKDQPVYVCESPSSGAAVYSIPQQPSQYTAASIAESLGNLFNLAELGSKQRPAGAAAPAATPFQKVAAAAATPVSMAPTVEVGSFCSLVPRAWARETGLQIQAAGAQAPANGKAQVKATSNVHNVDEPLHFFKNAALAKINNKLQSERELTVTVKTAMRTKGPGSAYRPGQQAQQKDANDRHHAASNGRFQKETATNSNGQKFDRRTGKFVLTPAKF